MIKIKIKAIQCMPLCHNMQLSGKFWQNLPNHIFSTQYIIKLLKNMVSIFLAAILNLTSENHILLNISYFSHIFLCTNLFFNSRSYILLYIALITFIQNACQIQNGCHISSFLPLVHLGILAAILNLSYLAVQYAELRHYNCSQHMAIWPRPITA